MNFRYYAATVLACATMTLASCNREGDVTPKLSNTHESSVDPKPSNTHESSVDPKPSSTLPTCFFDGDMSGVIRTTTTRAAEGTLVELRWDASAPAGAGWVPPAKITKVGLGSGIKCLEPYDYFPADGITAQVAGDRWVQLTLPDSSTKSLTDRCSSGKLQVILTLEPGDYTVPCSKLSGTGLPFHQVSISVEVPKSGPIQIGKITAGKFLEG